MKNILKAIRNMIDGVYHYVDEMVRKATEANPDWDQYDSTAKDYVKNRTHWSEIKRGAIVEEQTVNINYPETDSRYVYLNAKLPLVKGNTYTVVLNGIPYECVAWKKPEGEELVLGNGSFSWNEGLGEDVPFAVEIGEDENGYVWSLLRAADGDYTISIDGDIEMFHTLDEKYLPKSVPLQKDMWMRGLQMVFHLSRSGMMIAPSVGYDEITSNVSVTTWREFANALRNSFVCDTQTFYFSCYDMDHDEDGFPISFNLIGYEITTVDDVPTVKESGLKFVYNKEEQTVTSSKLS